MKKTIVKNNFLEISIETMTKKEYLALQKQFDNDEVFDNARKAFFEAHPDCPHPKPIEKLDLVLKKEYAREILGGTKKIEIRSYTDSYISRLYDKDVLAYEEEHWDDELLRMQMIDFNDSVRAVKTIHFHDHGNTWYLDVECPDNNTVLLVDDQVKYLQEQYDFHDFDEELADLNAANATERPIFFYFALGKILGTNL